MQDIGLLIVIGVVVLCVGLGLAAWLAPKLKKYRLVSPLKKVETKRKSKRASKKRRGLTIRIGR